MRVFQIITAIITAILIFSTTVCGLWIKSQGDAIIDKAGALKFHMNIGIITAIFVVLLIVTVFIRK
jgi:hypothetical protein